ncbi:MAG TPA: (Fe-S)-binding protein [Candidatus Kapabacteria bacterium]|nr:(Fe-S)-binding protein [Candidatus Kapabacteria bacterium]
MAEQTQIFSGIEGKLQACIHCGLCLEFCPTYLETHEEMSSPRGRIHLMKAVDEGTLAISDPLLREHEFSCLVCRSCETACPSGVEFSVLMEHTRDAIVKNAPNNFFRRFIYTKLLGSKQLTNVLQFFLAVAAKTRIISLLGKTFSRSRGILSSVRLLPENIPFPHARAQMYPAIGKKIGTVGLLIGCIGDVFTKEVNNATIKVLTRLGYDVHTLPEIGCCGALAAHAGYLDRSKALAREVLSAIEHSEISYFISNIAGCGAMMKDYANILGSSEISNVMKIKDISEFLFEHHYDDLKAFGLRFEEPTRIPYHAPCHLYHGQKIIDTPARLLSLIENATVTLLEENDICCGSAGTYNVERPEMAESLLERKLNIIGKNGSEIVATANAGCLMQLRSGLLTHRNHTQASHFIEVMASLMP